MESRTRRKSSAVRKSFTTKTTPNPPENFFSLDRLPESSARWISRNHQLKRETLAMRQSQEDIRLTSNYLQWKAWSFHVYFLLSERLLQCLALLHDIDMRIFRVHHYNDFLRHINCNWSYLFLDYVGDRDYDPFRLKKRPFVPIVSVEEFRDPLFIDKRNKEEESRMLRACWPVPSRPEIQYPRYPKRFPFIRFYRSTDPTDPGVIKDAFAYDYPVTVYAQPRSILIRRRPNFLVTPFEPPPFVEQDGQSVS